MIVGRVIDVFEVAAGQVQLETGGVEDVNDYGASARLIPDNIGPVRIERICRSIGISRRNCGKYEEQGECQGTEDFFVTRIHACLSLPYDIILISSLYRDFARDIFAVHRYSVSLCSYDFQYLTSFLLTSNFALSCRAGRKSIGYKRKHLLFPRCKVLKDEIDP